MFLNDPLVTVVDRNDELGSFAVRIGKLDTVVLIEPGRLHTSEWTKVQVGHAIKTAEQAGPYKTSHPFGDDGTYALHRDVHDLTSYYAAAVKAGHVPNETWLVKH